MRSIALLRRSPDLPEVSLRFGLASSDAELVGHSRVCVPQSGADFKTLLASDLPSPELCPVACTKPSPSLQHSSLHSWSKCLPDLCSFQ